MQIHIFIPFFCVGFVVGIGGITLVVGTTRIENMQSVKWQCKLNLRYGQSGNVICMVLSR